MSLQGIKSYRLCDHKYDGIQYPADTCPKCEGALYFRDICFDERGRIVLVENEEKLMQDIQELVVQEYGGIPAHPERGTTIPDLIGEKISRRNLLGVCLYDVFQELLFYYGNQRDLQRRGVVLNDRENMDRQFTVDVQPDINNPLYFYIYVTVKNIARNREVIIPPVRIKM